MATEDYNGNELQHMRRDARDAHSNSQLAKWLSILALIGSAIAIWMAMSALNKAGEAQSSANRNSEQINQRVNQ